LIEQVIGYRIHTHAAMGKSNKV